MLSLKAIEGEIPGDKFFGKAHDIFGHFIMALNIASLGHFTWDFQLVPPVPYVSDTLKDNKSQFIFGDKVKITKEDEVLKFDKNFAWSTLQLFMILAKEEDTVVKDEYLKGIYNTHHRFFNIDFTNEAFVNFYKAFEYFCTNRILGLKKLTNEKKQLRGVLKDFGFKEEILEDFDKIYVARSSQVMHAQRSIEACDKELLVRLKIFLDSLMHKHYKPLWEKVLNDS